MDDPDSPALLETDGTNVYLPPIWSTLLEKLNQVSVRIWPMLQAWFWVYYYLRPQHFNRCPQVRGMADQAVESHHYIIRGGVAGRERLKVLSRVMQPTTLSLLQRAGIRPGMTCADMGCGSGDVSFDLARLVSPGGHVVGMDIDEVKLDLARKDASTQQLDNIEFRCVNIIETGPDTKFDFVFARFLLTHLKDPAEALKKIRQAMKPGGTLVVADIDFRGYFSWPHCEAVARYVELYTETVKRRGGDPHIGPRLPSLLSEAGFESVQMNVVQLAGTEGEVKLLTPLTMENIAEAVLAEGLASQTVIDRIVAELYDYAKNPASVGCTPRIVEAWGRIPA